MKRLTFLALIIPAFLLSGCLNTAAVSVVEDVYNAALVENDALVESYFSEGYLKDHPVAELTDQLAEDVREMQGVKLLNVTEHTEGQLNPYIVDELNKTYDETWHFIVLQTSDDTIMTWIVLKGERHYSIVDGEKMDVEHYNEAVLK